MYFWGMTGGPAKGFLRPWEDRNFRAANSFKDAQGVVGAAVQRCIAMNGAYT